MPLRSKLQLSRVAPHAPGQLRPFADRIDNVIRQIEAVLGNYESRTAAAVNWAGVTDAPTTLDGYGITDAASDAELAAHAVDTTAVHGIADTSVLETQSGAQSRVDSKMAAHLADADPHAQYLTAAEGNAAYDALGAATSAVAAHSALSDPHPQYLTPAEGNAAYDATGAASSAISAHVAAANPHSQYAALAHTHSAADILTGILDLARGGTGVNGTGQAINTVFAGPASGSAGSALFRALVAADIPNLSAAKITSGSLSIPGTVTAGTDTSQHTFTGETRFTRAAATSNTNSGFVTGDLVLRYVLKASGDWEAGTGGVARDTRMRRSAAGQVTFDTPTGGACSVVVTGDLTTGGVVKARSAKSAAYTLVSSDFAVDVNATGGAVTITLPTAINNNGRQYRVTKVDASANAVTISTTASQTINGAATKVLAAQWSSLMLWSDGANWLAA